MFIVVFTFNQISVVSLKLTHWGLLVPFAISDKVWSMTSLLFLLLHLPTTPLTPPVPLLVPVAAIPLPSSSSASLRSWCSPQGEAGWCWGASEFRKPLERRGEVGNILPVVVAILLGGAIVRGLEAGVGLCRRHASVGQSPHICWCLVHHVWWGWAWG